MSTKDDGGPAYPTNPMGLIYLTPREADKCVSGI